MGAVMIVCLPAMLNVTCALMQKIPKTLAKVKGIASEQRSQGVEKQGIAEEKRANPCLKFWYRVSSQKVKRKPTVGMRVVVPVQYFLMPNSGDTDQPLS